MTSVKFFPEAILHLDSNSSTTFLVTLWTTSDSATPTSLMRIYARGWLTIGSVAFWIKGCIPQIVLIEFEAIPG
jgi:hypothetical protein